MDAEQLERLEVGERIAFERGRQSALAGDSISDGVAGELVSDLVSEIASEGQNIWDIHRPLIEAVRRGHSYGEQLLEEGKD